MKKPALPNAKPAARVGKRVRGALYVHRSAWNEARMQVPTQIADWVDERLMSIGSDFNVIRVESATNRVAFLSYGNFFEEAFPPLERSQLHTVGMEVVTERTYGAAGNPPILHRKELLLSLTDKRRRAFEAVTRELEAAGLFDEPTRIGYRQAWLRRLEDAGVAIRGGSVVKVKA